MGNAESCRALQTELEQLESTLSVLAATNPIGRRPLLPHHIEFKGLVLGCRKDVKVNVGPIVGAVGLDYARILLEVDATTSIACHVSRQDERTGQWLEVERSRVQVECVKNRPSLFHMTRLRPDTRYTFAFSGLNERDATSRYGTFHTLHVSDAPVQIGAVSGNNVYDGDNIGGWERLAQVVAGNEEVAPTVRPPVHYILHLGGQIHMERTFQQCWVLLSRYVQSTTPQASWEEMEAKVVERMRDAYRFQWSLPHVRNVLANVSNLMLWSDQDIYADFTCSEIFKANHESPTIQMQIMRTLLRSARLIYHEYQRQLWDANYSEFYKEMNELVKSSEAAINATVTVHRSRQEIEEVEKTLATAKRKMEFDVVKRCESRMNELKAKIEQLQKEFVKLREQIDSRRGEEYFFKTDSNIGFLMLDMRGSRLTPAGAQSPDNPILSPAQWDYVLSALGDTTVRLLVICSELPIVDDSNANITNALAVHESASVCRSWWGFTPRDQERLLALLSEWKLQVFCTLTTMLT
ncbi:hypothetical protein Ae201684P_021831 [Aphanomyces euteiches]|nr:hypothetical protein Ae201684P_021831 [Aphanomyces euteiches]